MFSLARLRRAWFAAIALTAFVAAPQTASAQTYSWNLATGGEWLNSSNWTPGSGPPNAVGAVASFGNGITNTATITITGAATVGEINFTGLTGTQAYTIGAAGNTITLNSGGGTATLSADASVTSTATQLIQSNLAVSSPAQFAANINGGTVQVSGSVGASGGMVKNGAGTLILTGNNSGLTGGIVVNGGALEVHGQDSGPVSSMGANAVTVNSGGQFRIVADGFWQPSNALNIAGNGPSGAPLYSDAALWFNSNNPVYYLGPVTLSADASMRLDGAFLFRGSSNGMVLNGHQARFTGGVATVGEVDGVISDGSTADGRVFIDIDGGNIGLDANNTYTGTTTVNRGTLFIDRAASLGQALGTAANGVIVNDSGGFFGPAQLYLNGFSTYTVANKLLTLNGGLVVANGGNKTWTGAITVTAANSIIGAEGIGGNFTISGGINLNNFTLTLRPNFNDSVITIDTIGISGTGGVTIIPVTGQGTVNLNVTSTYSGPTLIQSHNVFVNATQGTGTGTVTVSGGFQNGGTLRGVGSVTGAVSLNSGGVLFPGGPTTPGNLTLNGGVNFSANSQFMVRVVSDTSFDSATVANSAVLGNAILGVNLSGAGTSFNPGVDKLYILKMSGGSSLQAGTTFNIPDGGFVGSTSLYNFYAFYDYAPNGGVYLMAQPVPEPGWLLAVAAGALGLARIRRRARAMA